MDEYIKREAAIKVLRGKVVAKYPASFYMGLFAASNELDDIPAADVAPVRHGRWLHHAMIGGHIHAECSECHKVRIIDNYCPNCGCRMDGGIE